LVAKGLPSILQFHLKRFNYDWQTDRTTKLNNQFTFPKSLDLSFICAGTKEGDEKLTQYELHGIVVHVGEYGAGHYYAYVRPDMSRDIWYRFNDHVVEKVSFEDVINDSYGGKVAKKMSENNEAQEKRGLLRRVKQLLRREGSSFGWGGETSNAYVVQYLRKCDIPMLYNN
jgi:ubiquitin carboxyl-terminal hydrolase 7